MIIRRIRCASSGGERRIGERIASQLFSQIRHHLSAFGPA
jgi:hypothetical protein